MIHRWCRAGAAALLAALAPPAQQPALAHGDFTRLHSAWIQEILDLDVAGAIAAYREIAHDQRPANLERWIAVARLAELARLGIATGPLVPMDEAPAPVRAALALLVPLPENPATAEAWRGVDLRPAVPVVQSWVRRLVGPSMSARSEQRFQALVARTRPDSRALDQARIERDAHEVLRSELDGRAEQAASRRELLFRDWRPPAVRGEPDAVLERVRSNLAAWLAEPDLSDARRARLLALREEIQHRAAASATAALDLVLRLPYFAERLLAEPASKPENR